MEKLILYKKFMKSMLRLFIYRLKKLYHLRIYFTKVHRNVRHVFFAGEFFDDIVLFLCVWLLLSKRIGVAAQI